MNDDYAYSGNEGRDDAQYAGSTASDGPGPYWGRADARQRQHYARVPAEMGRAGWQRTAPHTATAGQVRGTGASQTAALESLAGQLSAMAGAAYEAPRFWWDADNGGLHVVIADHVSGGHRAYAVMFPSDGRMPYLSTGTTGGSEPASEALTHAVGLEQVTTKHGRPTA